MADIEDHYQKVGEIEQRYKERRLSNSEIVTFLTGIDLAEYISKGDSTLEVGCGEGNFLRDLWNKYSVAIMRLDMFWPSGFRDFPFVQGSAEQMPFKNNSFDFVFSYFTFPYIPDKLKALSEVHRVLKPGKRAVIDFGILHPNAIGMFDLHITPCLDHIILENNLGDEIKSEEVLVINESHKNPRQANRVTITKKTDYLHFPELKHFRTHEGNFPFAYSYY